MSFLDDVKKALGAGASAAGQEFLTRTPEGAAIVGNAAQSQLQKWLPWIILGGVLLGMGLSKGRR